MLVSVVQQRVAPNNRLGQVSLNQNKPNLSKTNQNPSFGVGFGDPRLKTTGTVIGLILGAFLVAGTAVALVLLDNSGAS